MPSHPLTALPLAVLSLIVLTSVSCSTATRPVVRAAPEAARVVSIAFNGDGTRLFAALKSNGACRLTALDPATGAEVSSSALAACPEAIEWIGGGLLLRTGEMAVWSHRADGDTLVAAASETDFVRRAGSGYEWVRGERSLPLPSLRLRRVRVLDKESVLIAILEDEAGENLIRLTPTGEIVRLLSEPVQTIDSYDVSPDQKEFVVSAARGVGFDVALGSTATPLIRWVAMDPLDEVMVSWAPRGSKITYLTRGRDGSLLRSLHVPTGYSLTVDLPQTHVTALAWEPRAERFAIAASGPGSSSHIQVLAYGGEGRRTLLGPEQTRNVELEPFFWPGGSAWLSKPDRIRHAVKYPVRVWTAVNEPFEWNDRRAELDSEGNVALLVPSGADVLGPAFWEALAALPWADLSRVIVVDSAPDRRTRSFPAGVRVVTEAELGE